MESTFVHFLDHWHTWVIASAAIAFGTFLVVRYVRELFGRAGERPKAKSAASRAAAQEFLLVGCITLLLILAARVEQLGQQIAREMAEMRDVERASDLEHFHHLRGQLDRNLEKIFGDHVQSELNSISQALTSRRITVTDLDEFRSLYKATLLQFSKDEFWATSLPSKAYFWRDPSVDSAIAAFTKNGGRMTRVFFVDDPDHLDPDANDIIARQLHAGVTVYVVKSTEVPPDLSSLFLVDVNEPLAWQASTNGSQRMTLVTATANSDDVELYRKHFQGLLALSNIRQLHPRS
jgi:hypothetical protein